MLASRGEIKIHDILEEAGFFFQEEYSFPDLKSYKGNPLRFDFCVFEDDGETIDFLIEYNGIQHYIPKSKFGGLEGLRKQKHNDHLKKEYCKKHGYKLIIIPYTDENIMDYDYIVRAAYDW